MELKEIPKSFWHSASFALIAFTLGFLFISYKSGELTIKFNQLEIRTSDTVAMEDALEKQSISINEQKQVIDQRESTVKELEQLLQKRLRELNEVKRELAKLQRDGRTKTTQSIASKIEAINKNEDFNSGVKRTKNNLTSLQVQQQLFQKDYKQQQQIFQTQQQQKQKRSFSK